MANVKIRLIVDTIDIPENQPQQKDLGKYCWFADNHSTMLSTHPDEYITNIEAGQMVEWSGVALAPNSSDLVSIDSISKVPEKGGRKNDYNMFGVPVLIGKEGTITASILAGGRPGDNEIYRIRFTVIKNDSGHNNSYYIDPKLAINN